MKTVKHHKNLKKNNPVIAKYMGVRIDPTGGFVKINGTWHAAKWHNSFDWIMEVVHRIESSEFNNVRFYFEISPNVCRVDWCDIPTDQKRPEAIYAHRFEEKEAMVYDAVVEFLKREF